MPFDEGIVLVLDPWDFGAEKRARSFGNHFVHHFDREILRILEHEHDSRIERRALLFQVVLYCFYGNIGKLALEQSLAGERTKKR